MDSLPTAREDNLGIGSMSLHFAAWGTARPDRTVLLIHALTASHREFADLGPALAARGWYVVAPDLRGRGLSDKPAHGYGVAIHANDLLTLADKLGAKHIHLVGHSLGAAIGAHMAAVYPQRIGKLVMVDRGGKVPQDAMQAIAASVNRLGTVYPSLDAFLGLMRQLPVFTWNPFWERYFRYDADVRPDGTVVSRVPKAAIEEEIAEPWVALAEVTPTFVKVPTLLMRATQGTLAPDRGFVLAPEEAERLRTEMPDCRVVEVPDTNHYTIIESPVTVEAIASFLEAPVAVTESGFSPPQATGLKPQ
jgi:pimeloyl-ACP methyl ester carboxylesterase